MTGRRDWLGGLLLALTLVAPGADHGPAATSDLPAHGRPRVRPARRRGPLAGTRSGSRRSLLAVAFGVRCLTARRPLVDVRRWAEVARRADLLGAALLALALAGIILAFATADPEVSVFSPAGPWLLTGSLVAAVAVLGAPASRAPSRWCRTARSRQRPAWGALVVSFFVGAALIAALVDIPIFARVTVYPDLAARRRPGAGPAPGRAAGRRARRRLRSSGGCPRGWSRRSGWRSPRAGSPGCPRWGLTSLSDPVATVPLVAGRPRLRPGARAGQRRAAGGHRATRCTASPARCWWWPAWSACSSASRR